MKTFVVLAVSIVLVSILFCPMVMSAPSSMPDDVQIVEPDPSLPKELAAFWGKWEVTSAQSQFFVIIEKIDDEKANLHVWRGGGWPEGTHLGWDRFEAKVIKERGQYILWYPGPHGNVQYNLKGEYLIVSSPIGSMQLRRVR
jgi:hypothetical protein